MKLTVEEFTYLGLCLEGFLFGLYSWVFAALWQYRASKEDNNNTKQNIIFYSLSVLYVLSVVLIVIDIVKFVNSTLVVQADDILLYRLGVCQIAVFACCDFIAQSILIHRCWIIWSSNTRVIIIPSILTFAFLGPSIDLDPLEFITPSGLIGTTRWGNVLGLIGVTASMTVNGLVTGLIVFRIFKVFHQVKIATSPEEQALGTPGGRELRSIMFILIESGMALFVIQFTRVMITIFIPGPGTLIGIFEIIVSIHEMLNGITPTIIQVRVAMGFSFDDDPSLEEAVGSLRFASIADELDPGIRSTSPDGLSIEPGDPIPICQSREEGL